MALHATTFLGIALCFGLASGSIFFSPVCAQSAPPTDDDLGFSISGQTTAIVQRKLRFSAAYTGANSLSPQAENSHSLTLSAALLYRLPNQLSFELHPEAAKGVPLSRLTGFGGFPNNELARTSGPGLTLYRARAFVSKAWKQGDNELRVTAGNMSVIDIFDQNTYSHDPRTQFLNWSLVTYGAFDYAADARGYTWGGAVSYQTPSYAVRFGRYLQPRESNGLKLNPRISDSFGDVVEIEKPYALSDALGKGKFRALAFHNQAVMGAFDDAVNFGIKNSATPDVGNVRRRQSKVGVGLALEHALNDRVGFFARMSAHDGKTESYAFTQIDRSISVGSIVNGANWGRAQDNLGVALAINGLSKAQQRYLGAGGLGFFLGDGKLNYGTENILEVFYSFGLPEIIAKTSHSITLNFQHIQNPGYNRDRGPATIFGVRWHTGF